MLHLLQTTRNDCFPGLAPRRKELLLFWQRSLPPEKAVKAFQGFSPLFPDSPELKQNFLSGAEKVKQLQLLYTAGDTTLTAIAQDSVRKQIQFIYHQQGNTTLFSRKKPGPFLTYFMCYFQKVANGPKVKGTVEKLFQNAPLGAHISN